MYHRINPRDKYSKQYKKIFILSYPVKFVKTLLVSVLLVFLADIIIVQNVLIEMNSIVQLVVKNKKWRLFIGIN